MKSLPASAVVLLAEARAVVPEGLGEGCSRFSHREEAFAEFDAVAR